jgi:CheY-like chemotaxis protein
LSSPTFAQEHRPADGPTFLADNVGEAVDLATQLRLVTGRPAKVRRNALAKLGAGRWTVGLASARPARVLIVDDAAPFRQAVRELLERRGYVVVGEAASAASALAEAARVRPDAVLLDVHLPDGSGLDVCTALCSARPAPAVLLVSMYDLPGPGGHVAACGARGFVLKSELASTDLKRYWPDARPGERSSQ